jgi:undecaprenyl diphosphate synthase
MISIGDIQQNTIPSHIAIIMDGNGRWAQRQGKDRVFGHQQGVETVRKTIEACVDIGVKYLSLYAFSTENWNRDPDEVRALMELFMYFYYTETDNLHKNNICVKAIGNLDMLSDDCRKGLQKLIEKTQNNTALTVVIALSYGSRWEITHAAKQFASDINNKEIDINTVDEKSFARYLQTSQLNIPDPDLLIRTSNEFRISNFLLWQIAYTELYFTDVLWPDFNKDELLKAIHDYQYRTRRFGKTNEQLIK